MQKTERVCQYYKISIRKNGDVFPCCLGKPNAFLGNIFDEDIIDKILTKNVTCECELFKTKSIDKNDKINLKKIHIMFSHECQAHCVCCRQMKDTMEREDEHLNKLLNFIDVFQPEQITVLGGEVLIQPKTLNWIEDVKNKYPNIMFDIVTNLCVGENTIKRVAKIFSQITVSILGFNKNTYNQIMGLDYDTTMKNFNYLQENTNIKLQPKFLTMPTNIYDLPLFLDWALKQKSEKIYLHDIDEFTQCCNLSNIFWQKTFSQVEKDLKKILENKKDFIISKNRHFISFHRLLASSFHIDEEYITKNGFQNIIKITS